MSRDVMGRVLSTNLRDNIDWPLVVSVTVLAILGITNLYSATSTNTKAHAATR